MIPCGCAPCEEYACPGPYDITYCDGTKDVVCGEDECASGSHQCSEHATCRNTKESYECTCKPGFIGDGFHCAPPESMTFPCQTHADNGKCEDPTFAGLCAHTCKPFFVGRYGGEVQHYQSTDPCDPNDNDEAMVHLAATHWAPPGLLARFDYNAGAGCAGLAGMDSPWYNH